jgi:YD repeat-containing protein
VDMNVKDAWGTAFSRTQYFLDQFDRSLIEYQLRNDGYQNVTRRDFDALGRIQYEYMPYTGASGGYATIAYDLINRPTSISRPISDTNPAIQSTTFFYEGLTSKVRDAQNKDSVKIMSAAGLLARSVDHDGYYQSFDYDAFGNLSRVQDSVSGNPPLQTSVYNTRGMLTQRTDMDMGTWVFDPNALGEVVHVRDAKTSAPNWTQTFEYDLLGRLKKRTENEGISEWIWGSSADNTPTNKYIGLLKSVSGPG